MKMEENIVTFPNVITLCRLFLIPFLVIALVYNKTEIAVLLVGAIALSDGIDGLSARLTNQKTEFGAILDSATDWLVILSAIITFLVTKRYLPMKTVILLLVPMIAILIAKGIYVKKKNKTTPTIIGKITFAFASITLVSILMDFAYKSLFLIAVTILVYATMLNYIIKDIRLFSHSQRRK